jgi:hypothetical protein
MTVFISIGALMFIIGNLGLLPEHLSPPEAVFEGTAKDFGKVVEGITLRHAFTFSNRGQSSLRILSLRFDCACVTATSSAEQIGPQQRGQIEVKIDARGIRNLKKNVVVETNDPINPFITLILHATIEPAFLLSDNSIYFDVLDNNYPATKVIFITLTSDMKLLGASSTDTTISAKLIPIEGSHQRRFKLVVVRHSRTTEGYYFGKIIIRTSGFPVSQIVIPFRGMS